MSGQGGGNHLLALKVLRLSKPHFTIQSEIKSNLLSTNEIEGYHFDEIISDFGVTDFLELPPAFGNIYLGETFVSYLCVNNDSTTPVNDVAFKAELQTTTQRFTMVDTIGNSPDQKNIQVSLLPRQSTEFLLEHEIKELGIHILVCSCNYTPSTSRSSPTSGLDSQRKFFRKFFKFQVLNPLFVKTKVNTLQSGVVSLEIQIQNMASVSLTLENLLFQPNEVFTATDLNDHPEYQSKILAPQDIRQYLYILNPTASIESRTTPNLGKLDISWKSLLGQSGHLQTSQLTRKVPSIQPFQVQVLEKPSAIYIEKPFKMKFRIQNNLSSERLLLTVRGNKAKMNNILLRGSNDLDLGILDGQAYRDFELELFPLALGIQQLCGLVVAEKIGGSIHDLEDLAMITVLSRII